MGTGIQWTDETWNPIRAKNRDTQEEGWHCELVSPGCTHCYAAFINQKRPFGRGTRLPFVDSSRDKIDIFLDDKTLLEPLRWKKPRRIFVCSMTDLFADWVSYEWLDKIYAVMALCPQHTFQVLTKRPERMRDYLADLTPESMDDDVMAFLDWSQMDLNGSYICRVQNDHIEGWPLPNVWHGTSVEDQKRADERIPILLECPSAVRFLSCEPLLSEVNLHPFICRNGSTDRPEQGFSRMICESNGLLHWVIVGGESGADARTCTIGHIRQLVQQCRAAEVPVFCKQLGKNPINREGVRHPLKHSHGGNIEEWPEDLRVREWPA